MKTYQLDINITRPNTSTRDKVFQEVVTAANRIEMQWSEYFVWEDDAQESLSRSSAIKYAEEGMQEYVYLKDFMAYEITVKQEEDDDE